MKCSIHDTIGICHLRLYLLGQVGTHMQYLLTECVFHKCHKLVQLLLHPRPQPVFSVFMEE